jgi:DUF917 family protein
MKRLLDQDTLRAMARGCAVLGAGRDTYYALLQALQAAEDFGPAALVDVDELPGDGLIMPCGGVGAPLVGLEKIEVGDGGERLRDLLQRQTGRTVTALMAGEIGGGNGLVPVAWPARWGFRWWTLTAWAAPSPWSRRSPWNWPASRRVRPRLAAPARC